MIARVLQPAAKSLQAAEPLIGFDNGLGARLPRRTRMRIESRAESVRVTGKGGIDPSEIGNEGRAFCVADAQVCSRKLEEHARVVAGGVAQLIQVLERALKQRHLS